MNRARSQVLFCQNSVTRTILRARLYFSSCGTLSMSEVMGQRYILLPTLVKRDLYLATIQSLDVSRKLPSSEF
jgi:hypothetical protein